MSNQYSKQRRVADRNQRRYLRRYKYKRFRQRAIDISWYITIGVLVAVVLIKGFEDGFDTIFPGWETWSKQ